MAQGGRTQVDPGRPPDLGKKDMKRTISENKPDVVQGLGTEGEGEAQRENPRDLRRKNEM